MSTAVDRVKFLRIYLEDHHAGETAVLRRAERLAEAEASSADAAALARFAADVSADLHALIALMDSVGVEPSRLKAGLAAAAEKVGGLKPNGRLLDRSPLSTVIELEAMQMAVRGKRALWETLQVALAAPTVVDLHGLIQRADEQLAVLAALHNARAAETFSPSTHLDTPADERR